jgi:adenylate kinase
MIAVILGPPGAGKSKQSELLRDREHIKWLYVGKLLREQNDPEVDKFLDSGQLVRDDIVNKLVAKFIDSVDPSKLVVMDGFPRHLPQAEWLVGFAASSQHALKAVIHLMVPAEVTKLRLAGRAREDDTPEVVISRLNEYESDIAPVVGYFERSGIPIHPVDGNRPVEEVFNDMDRILDNVHKD